MTKSNIIANNSNKMHNINMKKNNLDENVSQLKNYSIIRIYSSFLLSFVLSFVFFCLLSLIKEAHNNEDINFYKNPVLLFIWILSITFAILTIYKLYIGIRYLILFIKIKKDNKENEKLKLNDNPMKISISKNQKIEDSQFNIMFIKLKFKQTKLLIPFINNEKIKTINDKKGCCQELTKITSKIKYLKNSKVIIFGSDKYTNEILNYINKNENI